MDSITFFKFNPADYKMGKIQRCPDATRARFIDLCCFYWNKGCDMTYEDASLEIDREHIDCLIEKKVIRNEEGNIRIKFLDEQYFEVIDSNKKKGTSGAIGNLKRWNIELYEDYKSGRITLADAIAKHRTCDNSPSQNIAEPSQPNRKTSQNKNKNKKENKTRRRQEEEIITPEIILDSEIEKTEENVSPGQKSKKQPKIARKEEAPTLDMVQAYFVENGYKFDTAKRFFDYYAQANWHDSQGKPVRNWKQKAIAVWFKEENKITTINYKKNGEQESTESKAQRLASLLAKSSESANPQQ